MKVWKFAICLWLGLALSASAQKAKVALEGEYSLQERYKLMKSNSQTFQDYKVIKGFILDGFWKITSDSLAANKEKLVKAEEQIAELRTELKNTHAALAQKEESIEEVLFDSTHISVFGFPLSKSLFLFIVAVVFGGLLVLLGSAAGSMRLALRSSKEKDLTIHAISSEFDDFRKKALEKEVKLSRELQNERNKLMEFKTVKVSGTP